jgi:cytochrome P450
MEERELPERTLVSSTTALPDAGSPTPRPIPRAAFGLDMLRMLVDPEAERLDMLGRFKDQYDRFGPAVRQPVPFVTMVNLFGPDANRLVLLDRDRIFSARRPWMAIMGRIFPNGLLLLDGDVHRRDRKLMHGAFTRPVLRDYTARMNPLVAGAIGDWHRPGERFMAFASLKRLTLDMAARIFVGVELGPETSRMNEAFDHLVAASMSRIRLPIPGLEFDRGLRARRFMVDFFRGLLPARRAEGADDMFSRLARAEDEEGERLDDQQVVDHMIFLMMAAHDTTTSTLTSMMYELARHPAWQERVREESRALPGDALDFDSLDRLEALTLVFRETLRRYPPLPVIPRIATEAFDFAGHRIPKDAMVVVSPIVTHHLEAWWDDPYLFDPDRFGPTRAEHERHTHSWIPFGGGPHMCLGLRFAEAQVKTILHHVVRRYRWSVPEGYVMPVQQAPISKPRDGLPLDLLPLDA